MKRKFRLFGTVLFSLIVMVLASLAVTAYAVCSPDSSWSGWSTTKVTATNDMEVQTATEYRKKTKSTTTSSSSSLSGWTQYDKKATGWTSWSAWQNSSVSSSSTREVKTQTVPAVTKTQYVYYRWVSPDAQSAATYNMGSGYTYEEISLDYQLSYTGTTSNGQVNRYGEYSYGRGGSYLRKIWYYKGTKTVTVSNEYKQYSYRDATYTYYYYKWSDWSAWTTEKLTANDTTQVESRVVYRYRYTAHQYGNTEVLKESTCTEPGVSVKTCAHCGDKLYDTLPLKSHNYPQNGWKVTKEPTCTENGAKANTCADCGNKTSESIKKTDHNYSAWSVEKKATCTTKGTKVKTCNVCGEKASTSIAKLGHNYSSSWTVDKKATCAAKGSKSHHCTRCSAKTDITETAKTDHNYKSKTVKATLSKNGKKSSVCSGCGNEKSVTTIYRINSVKLSATSYICDGKTKTPSVTVKDANGKTLKNGTDYSVSYSSGRTKAGTYKVTVTFKGNYSGSKTLSFKINKLAKISNLKQTERGKNSVKFSWKAVPGATKYEIQYNNGGWKSMGTTTKTYAGGTINKKQVEFRVRAVNAGGTGDWAYITCSAK